MPHDPLAADLDPTTFRRSAPILEAVAVFLLVVLGSMLLASTLMRHLGMGEPKLFEITRVAFVYLVGIAAIAAYLRVQNIVVPGLWRMNSVSHQLFCTLLGAVMVWLTGRFIYSSGWEVDTMSLLRMPEATPYVPVFIFAVAITLISASRAMSAWRSRQGRIV